MNRFFGIFTVLTVAVIVAGCTVRKGGSYVSLQIKR